MSVSVNQFASQARALKAAGRIAEAIAVYQEAVAAFPASAAAEHNLAAALGDAGRWREAEAPIRAARAKGSDAPETWLVLARCLQSLGRLGEAEAAFVETVRRRPALADAQRELAQLRWMRTGELAGALAELDAAIAGAPDDALLPIVKAQALEFAGRAADAFALLAALSDARPNERLPAVKAAQAAMAAGQLTAALAYAERGARLAPEDSLASAVYAEALLAAGRADAAARVAEAFRQRAPNDQHAIALLATAWRVLGDPRYRELYDYAALVCVTQLDAPQGWPDLSAYLADLAAALNAAHHYATHPFAQSVRQGSQAANILDLDHPAARALPQAIDGPIRRCLAALGQGADPLRSRNNGRYAIQGMWSIRMRAGGFHIDHVHPQGWMSSACYVETPRAVSAGREGWIRFGKPGGATHPPLEAEHFVEPKPGRLVLFPSYMWHGVVPFSGADSRLTFAFDLVPG